MQERIRKYLRDVARRRGRSIDVGLIGYGTTNAAILEAVRECDFIHRIRVRHSGTPCAPPYREIELICGRDALTDITEDVVFASPSVRREDLGISDSTAVTSDTDIFFIDPPENLFLVSGSDGKSTVTTLASLLLFPTFPHLFTGGNLGTPVASAPISSDAFLLELSSFNLRYVTPRSRRALITNVTPNHLDWHRDLHEYAECKAKLIRTAREAVIPLSCPFNEQLAKGMSSFALVSTAHSDRQLRAQYNTRHTVTLEDGMIRIDGEEILTADEIGMKEGHNVENLMSAIALTLGYTTPERIREVAESFKGLEHRCHRINLGGKEYVDSSIDTTPERTKTTMTSLGKRVHLILGGRGKGLSPDTMRDALIKYALSISLYGEVASEIDAWLGDDAELSKIPRRGFTRLSDAIDHADGLAERGDTVLLSPSATAYGEFANYRVRGEFFENYIAKKHGQI